LINNVFEIYFACEIRYKTFFTNTYIEYKFRPIRISGWVFFYDGNYLIKLRIDKSKNRLDHY